MGAIGTSLLATIFSVISTILTLYTIVIIAAAVVSWVQPNPYNPLVRVLRALTDPVFYRLRKWFPFLIIGGIDLSPVVVLLLIQAVKYFMSVYERQLFFL